MPHTCEIGSKIRVSHIMISIDYILLKRVAKVPSVCCLLFLVLMIKVIFLRQSRYMIRLNDLKSYLSDLSYFYFSYLIISHFSSSF